MQPDHHSNRPSTSMPADRSSNHAFEILISNVLRTGITASLGTVLLGLTISFIHHPEYVQSQAALERLTRPGAAFPHTTSEVVDGVRQGRGQAIIVVGLLMLVATPVLRVAISIFAFLHQGDKTFALITAVVLALLLISLFLGKAEG